MAKATNRATSNRAIGATKRRKTAKTPRRTLAKPAAPAPLRETPKSWTFLTNHAHVLIVLYSEPGLVLREVAQRVGITERAVQRIVQDLEEEGFVRRRKVGRKNEYEVLLGKSLRHPIEWHRNIGDLITLITG